MRISDWSSDVCSSDLCTAEIPFTSEWGGDWVAKTFINKASGNENMALVKGKIDPAKPTLVRMHVMSLLTDLFRAASPRSEEHTSELQSLMRISYAVFCLKKKIQNIVK